MQSRQVSRTSHRITVLIALALVSLSGCDGPSVAVKEVAREDTVRRMYEEAWRKPIASARTELNKTAESASRSLSNSLYARMGSSKEELAQIVENITKTIPDLQFVRVLNPAGQQIVACGQEPEGVLVCSPNEKTNHRQARLWERTKAIWEQRVSSDVDSAYVTFEIGGNKQPHVLFVAVPIFSAGPATSRTALTMRPGHGRVGYVSFGLHLSAISRVTEQRDDLIEQALANSPARPL